MNGDEDQYSIHKLSNLLNGYKTKYRCEVNNTPNDEEIFLKDDEKVV